MKRGTPRIKKLVQICIITVLAALLSKTVIYSFTSMPAFKSMVEVKDYQMSDLYNKVYDSREIRELSENVVLVTVDGLSRDQIANTIDAVSAANPKAIGVDILFEHQHVGDSTLINSLVNSNAVLAAVETQESQLITSYFCDSSIRIGVANMATGNRGSVVREFIPKFPRGNGFAMEIVQEAYPSQYSKMVNRGAQQEVISFPSIDFREIPADSVINSDCSQYLSNKIVLVGDNYNLSDMHNTPVGTMSGLKVHASIIETILREKHIHVCSPFFNWLIAILSCMLFVGLNVYVATRIPMVGKLIIRIVQLLMLYFYFAIGCWVFAHKQIYIDFSLSLAMIALGLLAYDCWIGIEKICVGIIDKIKKQKI